MSSKVISKRSGQRQWLAAKMAASSGMLCCMIGSAFCEPPPSTPPATPTPPTAPAAAPQPTKPDSTATPKQGDQTTAKPTDAKPTDQTSKPAEASASPYKGPNKPIPANAKALVRTTTPSGVIIEDYTKGEGLPLVPKAVVTFKSIGRLKVDDKKPFENNYDPDQPITANLEELMPGLRDGMLGMRVGGQRRIFIPAALAFDRYGRKDMKNDAVYVVPPDTDVVFDIELINFKFKFVPVEAPKEAPPPAIIKSESKEK